MTVGASVLPLVLVLVLFGLLLLLVLAARTAWTVAWRLVRSRAAHREDRKPAQPGKLDEEVEIVLAVAAYLAVEDGTSEIGGAHLIRAALCNETARACVRAEELERLIADLSLRDPTDSEAGSLAEGVAEDLRFSPRVVKAFELAGVLAGSRGVTLGCLIGEMRLLDPMLRERLPQEIRGIDDCDGPPPGEYVYILNDAKSPTMAVVSLVSEVFSLGRDRALYSALTVHSRGFAGVGPMLAEDAERLVARAREVAEAEGLPSLAFSRVAPDTTTWVTTDHGRLPSQPAGLASNDLERGAGVDDPSAIIEKPSVVEATDEGFAASEDRAERGARRAKPL